MISNKTLATIFLISLNMQRVATSSSSGTQGSSPSDILTLKKRQGRASKPKNTTPVLQDTTNVVGPVEIQGRSDEDLSTLQEPASGTKINSALEDAINTVNDVIPRNNQVTSQDSVWQRLSSWIAGSATEKFKKFVEEGSYRMARCLAITINDDDLLKLACSTVKTIEQYNGILSHLRSHNMVALFYIHGDIGVVKGAIIESRVYVNNDYLDGSDLETALPLALKEDKHDRFMELLNVRKGITAGGDGQRKRKGWITSFESFVFSFLRYLAPWEHGMTLRRFFTLCDEELRSNCHDILDALCQELVNHLRDKLRLQNARELLVDLIRQPSLLTPVVFARGFLQYDIVECRSAFIRYGWRETIQEGLRNEYVNGGKKLWRVMQEEKPDQFSGEFPVTEEARIAVLTHFPTKQQKEEEWYKKCFTIFFSKPDSESISHIFPDVLWSIIFGYAVSLTFTEDTTVSAK